MSLTLCCGHNTPTHKVKRRQRSEQTAEVKAFEQTKLYAFAMSLPLQALYGWGVWTTAVDVAARYRMVKEGASPLALLGITAELLTILFPRAVDARSAQAGQSWLVLRSCVHPLYFCE